MRPGIGRQQAVAFEQRRQGQQAEAAPGTGEELAAGGLPACRSAGTWD
jgi:hypothetical protein